jgi:hypothetical protein
VSLRIPMRTIHLPPCMQEILTVHAPSRQQRIRQKHIVPCRPCNEHITQCAGGPAHKQRTWRKLSRGGHTGGGAAAALDVSLARDVMALRLGGSV